MYWKVQASSLQIPGLCYSAALDLRGSAGFLKIPLLEFLDICSPAAAVGYAIGRIGCLLSGDGDYGRPTSLPWGMSFPNGVVATTDPVHPTPPYEFFIWLAIAAFLWHMGKKTLRLPQAKGEI